MLMVIIINKKGFILFMPERWGEGSQKWWQSEFRDYRFIITI